MNSFKQVVLDFISFIYGIIVVCISGVIVVLFRPKDNWIYIVFIIAIPVVTIVTLPLFRKFKEILEK